MPVSLDKLQTLDDHIQSAIKLLTDADQALEQAQQLYQEYSTTVKAPVDLLQAIKAIQAHLHGCTDQHNSLVAQIRQAKEDAAKEAEDNPYD